MLANKENLNKVLKFIIGQRRAMTIEQRQQKSDLITILLEHQFYANDDELIVDELLSIFIAGMKTVQISTTNLICYLEQQPEIKARLLAEIIPAVESARDDIVNKLEYDTVMEFEYLNWCYYESLRIEPPLPQSVTACFNSDVTIQTTKIAAG